MPPPAAQPRALGGAPWWLCLSRSQAAASLLLTLAGSGFGSGSTSVRPDSPHPAPSPLECRRLLAQLHHLQDFPPLTSIEFHQSENNGEWETSALSSMF